ncbi:hypothetical protein ERC79_02460 [Rhodococcus sp. ABRD24]|uniref:hypothetical protein n=1 Tax=Rhodococcus sp. ABRD24 TaxID=2507582 RepID=UPI0010395E6A|nr:hypothetical protein [Rhodococcus sp. ABRD24]QBJ94950.1 hypothetical protein ERC79_02460 [Rhodococcus sp. ABRD24]
MPRQPTGLLAEQPRHGFDLEKVIDARGIRQWTDIGFSSIYRLLGKLLAESSRSLHRRDHSRPSNDEQAEQVSAPV